MITEALLNLWTGFASWVVGMVPSFTESTQNAGLMGMLVPVIGGASQLGAWIPWAVAAIWLPLTIGVYLVTLVLRIIKSLIPTISG